MKKNKKINDKKLIIIGSILLVITFVFCFFAKSFKNIEISGSSKKATIIENGTKVPLRLKEPSDQTSYDGKTLKQILTAPYSIPFKVKVGGKLQSSDYSTNLYWIHYINNADKNYVFCIEIGNRSNTAVSSDTYRTTSQTSSYWNALSNDAKKGIDLTLYYYDFLKSGNTSYTNDLQYFVTQFVIWEFQQGWRTFDSSGKTKCDSSPFYSNFISKHSKMNEYYKSLLSLIDNHGKKPNFSSSTVKLEYSNGKFTKTLTDSNKVLDLFTVSCPTGLSCSINSNKLTIVSDKAISSEQTATFTRKYKATSSNQARLVIDDNSNQRMAFGVPVPSNVTSSLKITSDKLGTIKIVKTSEDGQKEGFEFKITGPENYEKTFKTNSDGIIQLTDLVLGRYTITEENVPENYIPTESQTVNLTSDLLDSTKSFYNELVNNSAVVIRKIDKETEEPLKGAELTLKASKTGSSIESWTTDLTSYTVKTTLDIDKTYYVCELKAPDGYKTLNSCIDFKVTSKDEKKVITIANEPNVLTINKTDESGKALAGVDFQLYDSENLVDSWTTDSTGKHSIKGLIKNHKYTLKEISAPDGYILNGDQTFSYEDDVITVVNDQTKVEIKKYNSEDKNKTVIGGAKLEVIDSNGNVVKSFITENGKTITISGLKEGNYYLREVEAPDGYIKHDDITFTVGKKSILVEMPDDPTIIQFSKKSLTSGEELEGASLTITDSEGEVVESWISEKTPHIIKKKLIDGETYTLTETIAPEGYVLAESITFTVDSDNEKNKIEMKDKPTEVRIFKKDLVSGKLVADARLALYDSNGNVVHEWVTNSESEEVIYNLKVDEEYTIKEIKVPKNYLQAEEQKFILTNTEKSRNIIINDTPIVHVENTDSNSSTIAIVIGSILILGGVGAVIWMKKKNI